MTKLLLFIILALITLFSKANLTSIYETDTLKPYYLIDKLSIGEKLTIDLSTHGCFHYSKIKLEVLRRTDGYYATLVSKTTSNRKTKYNEQKSEKLSNRQLDALRSFEEELSKINKIEGSCTTTENYTLIIDGTKKEFVNSTCEWKGMMVLYQRLFGKGEADCSQPSYVGVI